MENVSILDQIISNHKAEEVANLDAVKIIDDLFGELSEREKDILVRRHGLHGEGKETLENIGSVHGLTRERIRQIETTSVKRLQQLKNLENYINNLKKIIFQLLEEHGGLMEREYLLDILTNFSINGLQPKEDDKLKHKNYLNFLITKLLNNEFEEVSSSKSFKYSYKLKFQDLEHLEDLALELLEEIKSVKKIFKTEELINLALGLISFQKHKEKLEIESNLDISGVVDESSGKENVELINKYKTLYSVLKAAKDIEQNKFGFWGIHNWREIKPKTINDKIFLVLKNHGEPMHFEKIANIINDINFDEKKANAATVHNELILDNKYVLVGRGIYGLREWGYKKGTVIDVIEEILNEASTPLNRNEIIEKVLEKRFVKKATIILALMNKEKFKKDSGKYSLNK